MHDDRGNDCDTAGESGSVPGAASEAGSVFNSESVGCGFDADSGGAGF